MPVDPCTRRQMLRAPQPGGSCAGDPEQLLLIFDAAGLWWSSGNNSWERSCGAADGRCCCPRAAAAAAASAFPRWISPATGCCVKRQVPRLSCGGGRGLFDFQEPLWTSWFCSQTRERLRETEQLRATLVLLLVWFSSWVILAGGFFVTVLMSD